MEETINNPRMNSNSSDMQSIIIDDISFKINDDLYGKINKDIGNSPKFNRVKKLNKNNSIDECDNINIWCCFWNINYRNKPSNYLDDTNDNVNTNCNSSESNRSIEKDLKECDKCGEHDCNGDCECNKSHED